MPPFFFNIGDRLIGSVLQTEPYIARSVLLAALTSTVISETSFSALSGCLSVPVTVLSTTATVGAVDRGILAHLILVVEEVLPASARFASEINDFKSEVRFVLRGHIEAVLVMIAVCFCRRKNPRSNRNEDLLDVTSS